MPLLSVSSIPLSAAIGQAITPVFLLGVIGTFILVLITRQNRVVDRVRALHRIAKDDARRQALVADIPRLQRRARLLNHAISMAVSTAITVTILLLLNFIAALGSFPNEIYVGVLFMLACIQFGIALILLALEVRASLPLLEFFE